MTFFAQDPRAAAICDRVGAFMESYVVPAIPEWHRQIEAGQRPPRVVEDLKALAKAEGLWNLFLPSLDEHGSGTRLSNFEYAPVAEIMGRVWWASEVFNCSAPDTGNMELLHLFATQSQREEWLKPLLAGEIRSCFAMTEPDVASSDATNIQTLIRRDGDDYVINGRKWFITGAADPRCRLAIVMGITNPEADVHRRQSMILVPMDAPGLTVVRNISVMHHVSPEGHCEVVFRDVRVPAGNLLGKEGSGFELAQARLGPGRIHHCMRSIGQCELALEMMCDRALERKAFKKYLHDFGQVSDWIAWSRIELDQARLLVMKTAWLIDAHGNKAARKEISMIKAVVPRLQTTILDRAIQVFGAMGTSPDTPLAWLWTLGRALRLADGPDEVHLRSVARHEIRRARERLGHTAAYMTPPERLAQGGRA